MYFNKPKSILPDDASPQVSAFWPICFLKGNATENFAKTTLDHNNFQIIVDKDSSYPADVDEIRDMKRNDTQSKKSIVDEDLKQLNDASQSQEVYLFSAGH